MEKIDRFVSCNKLLSLVDQSRLNNPHSDPKLKANHDHEHQHFYKLVQDAQEDMSLDSFHPNHGDIIRVSVNTDDVNDQNVQDVKVLADLLRNRYPELDLLVIMTTKDWDVNTMSISETSRLIETLQAHLDLLKQNEESSDK